MAASEPIHPPTTDDEELPRQRRRWNFTEGDEIARGRFALERLGGGYDYEAYLAWDEHLYSLVVAKLVRPHRLQDQHTLRSLAREAEMLARLDHPVIVRGFGADLEGPRPHVVMEHLEGPPLSQVVGDFGRLEIEQLLPLAFQIASALQYLVNEGVVHLDVKPQNIILGVPPRLIDLSIARGLEAASHLSSPVGTDAYMAPEQCDPTSTTVTGAADVWGLGATLFHAIGGELPFPREEGADTNVAEQRWPQLRDHPRALPRECPPELESIVLDCLAFEPGQRPSPADVAAGLEPLVEAIKLGRILGRGRPKVF